ncbi:HNH endonuclease [Salinicoccus halitifaciens]|uniref:Putative HNH nuclease YajD n=1 Tax=Salinicoccus halitifaciens TaxID=1073415 RepID=A0ABV2E5Q1_9STAP|nr:HNH endonuclease [Salinicoccus halitifaciens]
MNIKKRCNEVGCRELIERRETYCEKHKGVVDKRYNDYRNKYDREYISFYRSPSWRKKRKEALRRDNWICKDCEQAGLYQIAEEVHHIIEVKDDWKKRLDIDNLVSLCKLCHNKRHNR